MRDITVLITGAGAPGAPGIIKSLRLVKERNIRLVGVDMKEKAAGFSMVDVSFRVPPAPEENFVPALLEIAKREKVDVILPLNTVELLKLAKLKRAFFDEGVRISVSDPDGLEIANDKYLLMEYCRTQGIPVPDFRLVKGYEEFEQAVSDFGYPDRKVCLKPPVSHGKRGFRILASPQDCLNVLLHAKPDDAFATFEDISFVLRGAHPFPALLVLEYLPGDEYSVDVLGDGEEALVTIPRFREQTTGGISTIALTVRDQEIIEYSKKIVSGLKLRGNIGLQFKRDVNGVPKIIESNPRLQGTVVLCTAAGVNLPYLAVQIALQEQVHIPPIRWGIEMVRYWQEVFYDENGFPFMI